MYAKVLEVSKQKEFTIVHLKVLNLPMVLAEEVEHSA